MEAYVNVVGDVELDRFWTLFAYFRGKISCCLSCLPNVNSLPFSLFFSGNLYFFISVQNVFYLNFCDFFEN